MFKSDRLRQNIPLSERRFTAEVDADFVVFLIGMHVNRPLRVSSWLPVTFAMSRMVSELRRHPELGMLATQFHGLSQVQYWRSLEHLHSYVTSHKHQHFPAWQAFRKALASADDAVGIWHETYCVTPGTYEALYVNTPPLGLAQVGQLHQAIGERRTARGRMAKTKPS